MLSLVGNVGKSDTRSDVNGKFQVKFTEMLFK